MGSLKLCRLCCWVLVFINLIPAILCWGFRGHYATCKIAEGYLTKDAKAAVKELLKESGNNLPYLCSWPDLSETRQRYPWSKALHFADTPDFMCQYDYCRDCHDYSNQKNRCVTGATYNYTLQLLSTYHNYGAETKYNLTEALLFLSHFVGDVHQPLHIGFEGDLGGNKINVYWYNEKTNLHHVWDTAVIDSAMERFYGSKLGNMIQAIQRNITEDWSDEMKWWERCDRTVCPNRYASESVFLACKYAYKNATPGSMLDDEYFLSRLPIVEKRLAQGGIRLAATLNHIFGSSNGDARGKQSISDV